MTKLSVNINKVATLRNARGGATPDVLKFAMDCESFGAQGITVHPRPDQRHIRYSDVFQLKPQLSTEFNIEGYPSPEFVELVLAAAPAQVTFVPDPTGVITSNAGWNLRESHKMLLPILDKFKQASIRTSLFVDTDLDNLNYARDTGADRVELYTEDYAKRFHSNKDLAVKPYILAAEKASLLGLELNAGHDLNLDNLKYFKQSIPSLMEVSIGHALIADALYFGIQNTIQLYLRQLK